MTLRLLAPLALVFVLVVGIAARPVQAQPMVAQPPVAQPPVIKKGDAPPSKSDPTPPGIKRPVPEGPPEFEARFADDSLLKVVALDTNVAITTKYGKLTVPLSDVTRVEVGFRFPDGIEAQVEAAVTALGAAAFRDREAAERDLTKFAELAVPALKRASKSTDPEVAKRAESVLKKLIDKLPADKLSLKDYDVVETTDFVIRGRIDPTSLKVKTKLFGETALQLSELRGLRSTLTASTDFTIDATRYARQNSNEWFDTGIDLNGDQPYEITATGTIDLGPNQPGNYMSTPMGNPQNGGSRPIVLPNGRSYSYNPGTLVGRIGSDANVTPFVVGTAYKAGRSSTSGRLFLKIAPSAWGVDATGNYTIKVKIGG